MCLYVAGLRAHLWLQGATNTNPGMRPRTTARRQPTQERDRGPQRGADQHQPRNATADHSAAPTNSNPGMQPRTTAQRPPCPNNTNRDSFTAAAAHVVADNLAQTRLLQRKFWPSQKGSYNDLSHGELINCFSTMTHFSPCAVSHALPVLFGVLLTQNKLVRPSGRQFKKV